MFKSLSALALCVAIVFQPLNLPHSNAASCSVAGGQSGRLKYSGQTNSVSAKVCGNELWKLLPKPTKPVKKSKTTSRKTNWKNEFSVSPTTPTFSKNIQTPIQTQQPLELASLAKVHRLNRLLLWYPSQVQFTPKNYLWSFGDGTTAISESPSHSWSKPGVYQVKLQIQYSVVYRILRRTGWVALPGMVTASAKPQSVTVGESPPGSKRNVLVHWNCNQKVQATGC